MPPPDPDSQNASAEPQYEAFVRQFVACERRLRSFLRTLLPAWPDIDDVLQSTCVVAWRKFAQFEDGTSFPNWIFAIARFEALKHRRTQARSPLVFSDELLEMLAEEGAAEADRLEMERNALEHCLERLAPAQRELLEKSYQPGVRFHEIAAQAGQSATAFYKVIQRLRAALLECVQKRLAAEGSIDPGELP
jgi:RNA polymerase sigma-70 factor (ECF subfamily)